MRALSTLVALAGLAGCGVPGSNEQAAPSEGQSGNQTGAAGVAGPSVSPGLWRNTAEVVELSIPNLPPGATPPRTAPTVTNRCIRPDEAANPTFGLLAGSVQAGCRTERFSYDGGRIEGAATCDAGGMQTRMTMNGQFAPTTYVLIVEAHAQTAAGPVNTRTRIAGQRIGDCPN